MIKPSFLTRVKIIHSTLFLAAIVSTSAAVCRAADHGDAPIPSQDQAVDLGDVFAFLDPNDNTKLVLGMTFRGFIVPGEALNFGFFDELARYRFEIETTGGTEADLAINVNFSKRRSTTVPQTAHIQLPFGKSFTAPTTLPTLSATANAQTVTTDPHTGISFFAGEVDDPFFFDIPAFGRFKKSAEAGSPDITQFGRGRDSFAGYNIQAIALEIPLSFLKLHKTTKLNPTGKVIGVQALAQRRSTTLVKGRHLRSTGDWTTIDRAANPGLNVLVIPYTRKNEYNFSTPTDDAKGKFAADVVSELKLFGASTDAINTLAGIYITHGDYLHLDTSVANSGPEGGTNAGAGFPNGRRLADDVVDTFLTVVAGTTLGDGVDASDILPNNTFPFFAQPNQPYATGVVDDHTRN